MADAARRAIGEVADPELQSHADAHRTDTEQPARDQQRPIGGGAVWRNSFIAGCLEHAGDLAGFGHSSKGSRPHSSIETCE